MAIAITLKEFLENQNVSYDVIEHRRTDSTLETCEAAHIPGDMMAKSVLLGETLQGLHRLLARFLERPSVIRPDARVHHSRVRVNGLHPWPGRALLEVFDRPVHALDPVTLHEPSLDTVNIHSIITGYDTRHYP